MHLGPRLGFIAAQPPLSVLPDIRTLMSGWFDATDAASFAGTGQFISSLIAAPSDGTIQAGNHAYLGTGSGIDPSDAVFAGSAGSQGAYFSFNGSQQLSTVYSSLGTNSILNNGHRSDVAGTFIFWAGIIPVGDPAIRGLCGSVSAASQAGFGLTIGTNSALTFTQRAGGSTALTVTGLGVPRGTPVLIVASWDGTGTANNIRFWVNSLTKSSFSGTFLTATSSSTRNMNICSSGGALMVANGTQLKSFGYGNKFIDDAQAAQIFAMLQAKHGIDYTHGGVLGGPRNLVAGFGDSMTYYNVYNRLNNGHDMEANADGQYTAYAALTNQRLRMPSVNNLGVAGEVTASAVTRMATSAQGKVFEAVFIMEGTNDVGKNAVSTDADAAAQVSTAVANLNTIYDYFATTLGKQVFAVTIQPRSQWGTFTAQQIAYGKQNIKAINAAILAQNGSRGGRVRVLDLYSVLNDGTDSPLANTTVDGLHFSPYGAMLFAEALKNALGTYGAAPLPDFTASNLLSNGTLSGSGGTIAGGSGPVATSYAVALSGGTGTTPTATASQPSAGIQQLTFACPAGATGAASMTMSQTVTTGFAVGDIVYAQALVQVIAPTPIHIIESSLNLVLGGTGTSGTTTVAGMGPWGSGQYIAETYIAPGQYLIQTPDLPIAAGSGLSLQWLYRMTGDTAAGLAASGTVQIAGAGLFKR